MTGDELRRQRRRLGLTQVQLAARIGVHEITVSRWERGRSAVPGPVARLMLLLEPTGRRRKRRTG